MVHWLLLCVFKSIFFCPVPVPAVHINAPDNLFASTSPEFTCHVSVVNALLPTSAIAIATVVWDGPRGTAFAMSKGALVHNSITVSTIVTNVMANDSGVYTCRSIVSLNSSVYELVVASDEGSSSMRSLNISESIIIVYV